MTHQEIREKFIKFFEEKGHKLVPSSSLLPTDPSVLFTTAGVQQFKSYYTGQADPVKDFGTKRIISIQKSLRTVDIDEVGDASHITFFEMLGYFSFGDYFKKDTIKWTYEFVTKELGFARERIRPTVFKGDEQAPFNQESFEIWKSLGFSEQEIGLGSRKDNFWGPTGNEGPCGPCDELYLDDIEIGTLVFNEYYCDKEKNLTPLVQRGVDVGLGFERNVLFAQGVDSIYETDLFMPIMEEIRGKNLYDYEQNRVSERIIADHLRASAFLIADGVTPSNVEQGYILRRLLRRAIRHAKLLNQPEDIYERVLHVLAHDIYGEIYPELKSKQKETLEVILAEKDKFTNTLDNGLRKLEKFLYEKGQSFFEKIDENTWLIRKYKYGDLAKITFDLYQNYGFPIEMTIEELGKLGVKDIDRNQLGGLFKKELERHQELSRTASAGMFKGGLADASPETTRLHTAAHLMLEALRRVLGGLIQQKGSDITSERLRFDFSHGEKLTPEQIKQVEEMVNEQIERNLPVHFEEMSVDEAKAIGATGVFEHKYGDKVKVYTIGPDPSTSSGPPFSREICGGPHVNQTGEIGKFKIVKEESVSAGTRRIRAVLED